jgi:hypothetical protein
LMKLNRAQTVLAKYKLLVRPAHRPQPGGVLHVRQHPPPASTPQAREHIQGERPAQQPGPVQTGCALLPKAPPPSRQRRGSPPPAPAPPLLEGAGGAVPARVRQLRPPPPRSLPGHGRHPGRSGLTTSSRQRASRCVTSRPRPSSPARTRFPLQFKQEP